MNTVRGSSKKTAYKKPILAKTYATAVKEKQAKASRSKFEQQLSTTATTPLSTATNAAALVRGNSHNEAMIAECSLNTIVEEEEKRRLAHPQIDVTNKELRTTSEVAATALAVPLVTEFTPIADNNTIASVAEVQTVAATTPLLIRNTSAQVRIITDDMRRQQQEQLLPCTCGVFLTTQFVRGSGLEPSSEPVIVNELDRAYACNARGRKQCQTKCIETMVRHLPNSANIICATLERDCRKERAYLFIKNCRNRWYETNMAAGREYCCKQGKSYPCPMI